MINLPRRIWPRSASQARRSAAERALNENPSDAFTAPAAGEATEHTSELASMLSLTQTLGRLPEQAWDQPIKITTARSPARRSLRNRPRGVGIQINPVRSGVFVAVVVAFLIGALIHPFSGASRPDLSIPRHIAHVTLKPIGDGPSTSQAVAYMPGGDQMLVRIHGLPSSAPGTYYELWLMTSDTNLVSVTSFQIRATRTESLRLLLPDDPSHYKYLDISVQHIGDRDAISQDNVLRGAIHA